MPYNINSLAMKKVIEELPNVGSTSVSRADILSAKSFGYEWIVTFTSIESPSNIGVQDLFKIDDAKLMALPGLKLRDPKWMLRIFSLKWL